MSICTEWSSRDRRSSIVEQILSLLLTYLQKRLGLVSISLISITFLAIYETTSSISHASTDCAGIYTLI